MNRRRPWLILFFVVLAVAIAGGVAFNGRKSTRVRTQTLATGRVEEIVTSNSVGSIEPLQTAVVASEITGRIQKILVRQGEVKSGQPIFEIDSRDLAAEREVARCEIETSRARIDQAVVRKRKVSEDLKRLRDVDVPKGDIERLERDLEIAGHDEVIATRSIRTVEAQLALLQLKLEKTKVAAPFDGTVTQLQSEEGESVVPGKPLFTIQSSGLRLIRAPIDEVDMGKVALGLPVRVTFDAYRGEEFEGLVHEIMPAASTDKKNNRTVDVKVRLHKMPEALRSNMSANVEIVIRAKEGVSYLPTHLVRDDREGKGKFVLLAQEGRAVRRPVRTGYFNWKSVEISGGLAAGDAVIVPLQFEDEEPVKEGSRVIVVADGP